MHNLDYYRHLLAIIIIRKALIIPYFILLKNVFKIHFLILEIDKMF